MATTSVTMRLDETLKVQLQELLSNLGMDMTTFFTISAKQAVREQAIPFQITMDVPNKETRNAMEEIENIRTHPDLDWKTYSNVDDMFAEVLAENEV